MNYYSRKKNTSKSNIGRYIGIIIVSILLIVALIIGYKYWTGKQRKEKANEVATSFIEALEAKDYDQLTNTLSPSSLEEIGYTEEKVKERYETIYGGIGANDLEVDHMELEESEEDNSFVLRYDLNMTTSLGELETQSYETNLQEIDNDFFVAWNTHLIFPDMDEEDTIQIQFTSGKRGNILDRNGELLAGEGKAWQVGLHPAQLEEGEGKEENLQNIAKTFDINVEQLEQLLSAEWVTDESFVPFALVDEGKTPEITGVVYQETTTRSYFLGEAGAHLIGYIGEVYAEDIEEDPSLQPGDIIGKSGLEAAFDDRLRGGKGGEINILDEAGETKSTLQKAPVEDGEDITLTIDSKLQKRYFETFEGEKGGAVVTDPTSGELLVLTSSPSYDPTLMARGISGDKYQEYAESPDSPFLARYAARYAPGSTFKMITAAIGLESGTTNLEKTHTITGLQWQKDDSWGNYKVTRVSDHPTEVNLEDALIYSDNIFFAQEVLEMGAETYLEGLKKFPFDETFDLPINMKKAQISNSGSFDSQPLLADTAFGQGQLLMSPLHQAIFYSAFANNGTLTFPKLELNSNEPETMQPIEPKTAETIEKILVQVVEDSNGTAHVLNKSPLSLAAKTGTAEFKGEEEGNDTNGFVVAFDAENHSFLSTIFIEDKSGSSVANQFASVLAQHE